jgi:hypothetical protein
MEQPLHSLQHFVPMKDLGYFPSAYLQLRGTEVVPAVSRYRKELSSSRFLLLAMLLFVIKVPGIIVA